MQYWQAEDGDLQCDCYSFAGVGKAEVPFPLIDNVCRINQVKIL